MTTPDVLHGAPELSARQHLITVYSPNRLEPDRAIEYTDHYYHLTEWEDYALRAAVHAEAGMEKPEYGHMPGGMRLSSYGGALQTGSGTGPELKREGECKDRLMFDAHRGIGVISAGLENTVGGELAAATLTRGFLRAAARRNIGDIVNPLNALNALADASEDTERALGHAKAIMGEDYADAGAAMTGFQLLPEGRLALTHSGHTNLFIHAPDNNTYQLTEPQTMPDPWSDVPTNAYFGDLYHDQGGDARGKDQHTIVELAAGRNVIILTSPGITGSQHDALTADDITALINELQLDLSDPEAGKIISKQLLASRRARHDDGGALVVVVDVDDFGDPTPDLLQSAPEPLPEPRAAVPRHVRRGWLREKLDYIRPSTLAFAALARMSEWRGTSRREIYEEQSSRGKVVRGVARGIDIVGGLTGAYAIARVGGSAVHAALAVKGMVPHHAGTPGVGIWATPSSEVHAPDATPFHVTDNGDGPTLSPHPEAPSDPVQTTPHEPLTIQAHDTLWNRSTQMIASATGRKPTDTEVQRVVDAITHQNQLDNPNDIDKGEVLKTDEAYQFIGSLAHGSGHHSAAPAAFSPSAIWHAATYAPRHRA